MIGRRHRFHGYGTVQSVYRRGQVARGSALSLRYSRRDASKAYRAAVVVSRKVSKSAVTRNRIRRRIYEIIRQNDQDIPSGTDLIFTAFSDHIAEMNAVHLEKTVTELLKKTS